jgi:hypothetical protein
MTINTTCPTKHNPNLTCALGRIIKQTDEGNGVFVGTTASCCVPPEPAAEVGCADAAVG